MSVVAPEARLEPSTSQTFTVELAADALARPLALSLLARLESPNLGGSTFAMRVWVNGTALEASHLLNKPLETEMLSGLQLDWFGGTGWRVCYSPDYESANRTDHPACLVGGHAYDFVLALPDLLRAGRNEIVIRHGEGLITNALLLQAVQIVDAPPKVAGVESVEDPSAPLALLAPRNRDRVPYRLKLLPHGGLQVGVGARTLTVSSSFSYPNVGWNTLGEARRSGEEEAWQPLWPAKTSGDSLQLGAAGKSYRLRRTIVRRADHLAISDRLTNLTGADLHIGLKHMISTAGLDKPEVYVHGLRSRIGVGYDAGGDNPTVLVRSGGDALGLVAEDDVFRAQSAQQATADPAEAGLLDNYFMLEPGASYEVRWSIYPLPASDYFDFVNAVRRNWGTNFTVPGPFAFAPHPTVERGQTPDLKAWLTNGAMRIVCLEIPMPEPAVLSHGLAFLRETAEQERLRDQAVRLRAAVPGTKVLQYLHVYITRLDEAVATYADARHLGPDGTQLQYAAGAWKPTFWLFLPTPTNSYGREMNKTFDLVLGRLGCDGVYWDELAYSAKEIAYRLSDGHSGMPDVKTQTVQERIALTPLYCQAYQVQQARRVLQAGKMLIGNGQPVTATMTRLHFPRFVEAWQPASLRNAHLYCPVGLSSPDRVRREEDIVPSIRSHLQNGGLWYYYCGWERRETDAADGGGAPVPVHSRWSCMRATWIGKERILTARSGLFGWGDRSGRRVFVYGPDGRPLTDVKAPVREIGGKLYTELRLPPGALGIIERL